MKSLLFPLFVIFTVIQTTRAELPKEPPAPRSVADYRFNGNAKDEYPWGPPFELANTEFQDNALYLNGKYEVRKEGDGYHAAVACPTLDYNKFTVALRMKAEDFDFNLKHTNLFTGGSAYRWFGMSRSNGGNLVITLNNQKFTHEIQAAPLAPGKWVVVACGVDLPSHKVVVYFNGKKAAALTLPPSFKLEVADSKASETDKRWMFTNFSNGTTFHGLIDECIIYGEMLSDDEFARIPLQP